MLSDVGGGLSDLSRVGGGEVGVILMSKVVVDLVSKGVVDRIVLGSEVFVDHVVLGGEDHIAVRGIEALGLLRTDCGVHSGRDAGGTARTGQ